MERIESSNYKFNHHIEMYMDMYGEELRQEFGDMLDALTRRLADSRDPWWRISMDEDDEWKTAWYENLTHVTVAKNGDKATVIIRDCYESKEKWYAKEDGKWSNGREQVDGQTAKWLEEWIGMVLDYDPKQDAELDKVNEFIRERETKRIEKSLEEIVNSVPDETHSDEIEDEENGDRKSREVFIQRCSEDDCYKGRYYNEVSDTWTLMEEVQVDWYTFYKEDANWNENGKWNGSEGLTYDRKWHLFKVTDRIAELLDKVSAKYKIA